MVSMVCRGMYLTVQEDGALQALGDILPAQRQTLPCQGHAAGLHTPGALSSADRHTLSWELLSTLSYAGLRLSE